MRLSALVGARVYDANGRRIGRVIDATAQVQFVNGQAEYFVQDLHVTHFGMFDALAGTRVVQQLLERLSPYAGYRCFSLAPAIVTFGEDAVRIR